MSCPSLPHSPTPSGDAPHPTPGAVGSLPPPPLPPFSCLCPPHPPSTANFSALLPTDAAAGGTDGALGDTPAWVLSWLPTCIISPTSLLRTDAIRTQLTRGGGGVVKKNNTPNPPKPGAALPPPPPPPQLRPRAKVTFAREAASPKVPGKAPPAPPAAATRLKGVEIRGVL